MVVVGGGVTSCLSPDVLYFRLFSTLTHRFVQCGTLSAGPTSHLTQAHCVHWQTAQVDSQLLQTSRFSYNYCRLRRGGEGRGGSCPVMPLISQGAGWGWLRCLQWRQSMRPWTQERGGKAWCLLELSGRARLRAVTDLVIQP